MKSLMPLTLSLIALTTSPAWAESDCTVSIENDMGYFDSDSLKTRLQKNGWSVVAAHEGARVSIRVRDEADLFSTFLSVEGRAKAHAEIEGLKKTVLDLHSRAKEIAPYWANIDCGNTLTDPAGNRAAKRLERKIVNAMGECR